MRSHITLMGRSVAVSAFSTITPRMAAAMTRERRTDEPSMARNGAEYETASATTNPTASRAARMPRMGSPRCISAASRRARRIFERQPVGGGAGGDAAVAVRIQLLQQRPTAVAGARGGEQRHPAQQRQRQARHDEREDEGDEREDVTEVVVDDRRPEHAVRRRGAAARGRPAHHPALDAQHQQCRAGSWPRRARAA